MENRILLIHDADAIWDQFASDLGGEGFHITNKRYKNVSLADAQTTSPDLIILDFTAPHGGAGWIFLQLLTMEAELRFIPVLVATIGTRLSDEIEDYLAPRNIPVVYQINDILPLIASVKKALATAESGVDAHFRTDTFHLQLPDQGSETQPGRMWGDAFIEAMQPVVLEVDGQQLRLPAQEGIVLGRWSGDTDATPPDIDLRAFDALPMGVSRRHALISRQNALVYVTDLAARNGTWLNGQRLESHNKRLLRDGDELRLGRLQMRVLFKQGQFSSEPARYGHS